MPLIATAGLNLIFVALVIAQALECFPLPPNAVKDLLLLLPQLLQPRYLAKQSTTLFQQSRLPKASELHLGSGRAVCEALQSIVVARGQGCFHSFDQATRSRDLLICGAQT